MQASLSEKIIGLCSEEISLNQLSGKLSELISKSISLDCFAIYIGTKESVKLNGLFIDQTAFITEFDSKNKTLKSISDTSEIFSGIRIPELLYEHDFRYGNKEIKLGSFYFNTYSKNIKNNYTTILYGGGDKKQKNRAKNTIEKVFPFIELAVVSFNKDINVRTDNLVSLINSNLISNTMDIEGYMKIVIKLFLFYFNANYGSLKLKTTSGNFSVEIGKTNNQNFELEFNLKKDNLAIKLTLDSDITMLNTSQSHFLSDLSLEYFSKIVNNFFQPLHIQDFRISNLFELMKIFEALGVGKIGLTDRLIDVSTYIGEKLHFSEAELTNLSWIIALRNIGKVAIRFYFSHKSSSYENEYNDNVKSDILLYLLPKRGNPINDEILKASEFFIDITSKKGKILKIFELIDESNFDPLIKDALVDAFRYSKNKKCFDFYRCPTYLTKMCPAWKSPVSCFETQHTMGECRCKSSCEDCILFYNKR